MYMYIATFTHIIVRYLCDYKQKIPRMEIMQANLSRVTSYIQTSLIDQITNRSLIEHFSVDYIS